MTDQSYTADPTPVPESTLTRLFYEAVDRFGDAVAFQYMPAEGQVVDIGYREAHDIVERIAGGLAELGIEAGDRVAILSENRPEWALSDYGCLCARVIDVPVYATLTAPQVAYVLRDSGARLVFVSSAEQMDKALAAIEECEHDVRVVVFDPVESLPDGVLGWSAFLDAGERRVAEWGPGALRERALTVEPSDVATVLYTSGTTGDPKGVMLTHRNVSSNVLATRVVLDVGPADNTVSFLPLSHILQRMADFLFFWSGCTIGYPRSLQTLVADFKVLRPTVVVSVPRTYEKIYNGVMQARGLKKALIGWAVGVADRVADLRLSGAEPSGLLALKYALADRLVFSKVKNAVGGRLRFFVSGGGPLAPALNRFFYSIGLTILEGYGLTETSPVTNVNTIEAFRIGTVGQPVPQTEIRIAADGEILVRGPQVMKGYYKKPEATAAAIDADGYLAITDRKKDIIVTAGGKNVAPQPIENRLKTHDLVEQAVMIGDRRKYCSLLVVPAFDALERWARGEGLRWSSHAELVTHPKVVAHMESELFGLLADLASFERPKKIALLDEELTIENGFLTPTLKVKRRVVEERLAEVIDGLYVGEAADATKD